LALDSYYSSVFLFAPIPMGLSRFVVVFLPFACNDLHVGGLHMLFVGIKATLQPFPALLCPEVEIEGTFEPG